MSKLGLQITIVTFLSAFPLIVKVLFVQDLDYLVILSVWIPLVCAAGCYFSNRVAGIMCLLYFAIVQTLVLTSFDFSREAVTSHKFINLIGNRIFYGFCFAIALMAFFHLADPKLKRFRLYRTIASN